VTPTTNIGTVDTFPLVQSPRHQNELLAARRLYSQGRFLEAADVVKTTFNDEPDNPFLLNEYARALFRVDSLRPQSRQAYQNLVALLTDRQSPPANGLVIDLWFVDAYWKLAMLYLDSGEYSRALIELAKVVLAPQPDPRLREQVYAYLAEAYFLQGDHPAAQWFVDRTLEIDPANEYVLRFRSQR
jgi:tetratricopeptide (TPR) repeat protein